jgi:hypothetical protein
MSDEGDLISTDLPFSMQQRHTLQILAGLMIPANREFDIPGADDATIFADFLATARGRSAEVNQGIRALDELAMTRHGGQLATLEQEEVVDVVNEFRDSKMPGVGLLVTLVVQCYYRDDRVVLALGMEARPPYPAGFEVEEGDWSLLDPVRQRPEFYRKVP